MAVCGICKKQLGWTGRVTIESEMSASEEFCKACAPAWPEEKDKRAREAIFEGGPPKEIFRIGNVETMDYSRSVWKATTSEIWQMYGGLVFADKGVIFYGVSGYWCNTFGTPKNEAWATLQRHEQRYSPEKLEGILSRAPCLIFFPRNGIKQITHGWLNGLVITSKDRKWEFRLEEEKKTYLAFESQLSSYLAEKYSPSPKTSQDSAASPTQSPAASEPGAGDPPNQEHMRYSQAQDASPLRETAAGPSAPAQSGMRVGPGPKPICSVCDRDCTVAQGEGGALVVDRPESPMVCSKCGSVLCHGCAKAKNEASDALTCEKCGATEGIDWLLPSVTCELCGKTGLILDNSTKGQITYMNAVKGAVPPVSCTACGAVICVTCADAKNECSKCESTERGLFVPGYGGTDAVITKIDAAGGTVSLGAPDSAEGQSAREARGERAASTVKRVKCTECDRMILPSTAERNNGKCQPCQDGPKAQCFIATAACGDATHPDVMTLRRFREDILRPNLAGRVFIRAYYYASPPLARHIETRTVWQRTIRTLVVRPAAWIAGHVLERKNGGSDGR